MTDRLTGTGCRLGRVLVLGGTGFVGRALCQQLTRWHRDSRVVVPTRRLSHGVALRTLPMVELVAADVHDALSLRRLLPGTDAVVNLVAILHGSAREFEQVHVQLARQLAATCLDAGVRRVVHVSALGVGPDAPSNYLRSKTRAEEELRAAGLELTLLRPSVIFGAEDRFLNLFAQLQAKAPVLPLAGSTSKFQPVWVGDVAQAIVRCLEDESTVGAVHECAGPRVYTLSELVRLAGRWTGRERPQWPLPGVLGRLQAALLEHLPGPTLMSRDNIDSMRVPNVASGAVPGLRALGIEPTPLEAVAVGYLARG